jgi:hypothetical protein
VNGRESMELFDDILALCYLYKDGDEKNKALLTKDRLYVVHHKRIHEYDLENIKNLGFNHRKIMMPLIFGGIMASLSLVAVFKGVFNPYVVISLLMLGLGLFYYGWTGQLYFTVTTKIKDYDFSVPSPTENLKAFIAFVIDSGLMGRKAEDRRMSFYLILDRNVWESQSIESGTIVLPEKPFKAFLRRELPRREINNAAIIEFNPLKANVEVRFINDSSSGKLSPYLMGDIARASVVRVELV